MPYGYAYDIYHQHDQAQIICCAWPYCLPTAEAAKFPPNLTKQPSLSTNDLDHLTAQNALK